MIDSKKDILYRSSLYKWLYEKIDTDSSLATRLNLNPTIVEILSKRGIVSEDDISEFINSPLQSLCDPFLFKDMEKATARLLDTTKLNEKVCIYGDYDVDGVTSTSLMYLFLKEIGVNVSYYIPNRLEEGYGLNIVALKELADSGVKLLITVDCGISAVDEINEATSLGMDIIVTDHHEAGEILPQAYAIINPMVDENYPFKSLSGVGVAFKFITAIRTKFINENYFENRQAPNLKRYLDIVTLGTVADIVPLVKENRIFVKHGLQILNRSNRIGVSELMKVSSVHLGSVKVSHIGFSLAPRLNAVGRMGSSVNSIKLLLTDDKEEATFLANFLDSENKYRQDTEKKIFHESLEIIENDPTFKGSKSIVIMREGWHQGVVGIVASRLVDRYFKPAVVLAQDGDIAKGSARSIPAFHLHDSLSELSDMMLSFGGHKYAAGVKIVASTFADFQSSFNAIADRKLTNDDLTPEITIDAILDITDITIQFADDILKLEPFGASNKEPIFLLEDIEIKNYNFVGKEFQHLRGLICKGDKAINFIWYSMERYKDILSDGCRYNIVFNVQINNFNNSKKLQLSLKDIMLIS